MKWRSPVNKSVCPCPAPTNLKEKNPAPTPGSSPCISIGHTHTCIVCLGSFNKPPLIIKHAPIGDRFVFATVGYDGGSLTAQMLGV